MDLSKLVNADHIATGFRTTMKMSRLNMGDHELIIPVMEMTIQRGNGTHNPVLVPPDLLAPIAHACLDFLMKTSQAQQGATPPAPPTAPGPDGGPLSIG